MSKQINALKLALEALELAEDAMSPTKNVEYDYEVFKELTNFANNAITAIKEALAQPEQEPVAWLTDDEREAFERFNETCEDGEGYDVPKRMMKRLAEIGVIHHTSRGIYGITKFGRSMLGYTTPPQRKPLTDEQINTIWHNSNPTNFEARSFARAIEAAHGIKEKNT